MIFEHLSWLIAAPVLVIVVIVLAVLARRRRVAAASAWSRALGARARTVGRRTPWILGAVALAAAVGIAGPRWGTARGATESRARNIVVVVDVSRSMLAQDAPPDRLQHAVSLARRLVQDLDGDRFALVAFAGHAYVLSPLTLDQSSISLQLDALDPDMASAGGSGLAGGLDAARRLLVASPQGGDRAIVALTDGESFESPAALEGVGKSLARDHVTLVAIPVGSTAGTRIPEPNGGWHKDNTGADVITRRRDDLVELAVKNADGVMIPADAPDPVGDTRRALAHLNRASVADRTASDLVPRAWIFALLAAVLLLMQTLTRRGASLVAIALMLGAGTARAQRPAPGNRLLRRGDTARAETSFAAEVKAHNSDTAWFNAGTSALHSGDLPTAIDRLGRATLSLDPALRQRALYNLGTAEILLARRDTAQRDSLLARAESKLQESLLLAPHDASAKFNYELARKLRPPPQQQRSSSSSSKGKGGQPPPPSGSPSNGPGGMTPAQADQVLSAMERAERETRQSQQQRMRRGEPPLGPDW